MKNKINIDLNKFANGELAAKFKKEIAAVMDNVLDPNTDYKKKRKVTITMTFESNENRNSVDASVEVKSALAPQKQSATTVLVGRDGDTGYIEASELRSGTPGQTYFDEKGVPRTDAGKPIDEVEAEQKNKASQVIDLQAKK